MGTKSVKRASSWSLLLGLFDRPQTTFAEIFADRKRRWILPVSIFLLFSLLGIWLQGPFVIQQAKKQMALQLAQMPAENQQAAANILKMTTKPIVLLAGGAISLLFAAIIGWLLQALYFYFVSQMSGSDATFGQLWSGVLWLSIPNALQSLVAGLWARAHGVITNNMGLSFLFSTGHPLQDARNPLFAMAGQVNLFALWELVLIYAMLRGGPRLSKKASLIGTILFYLLSLGLVGGMALLGGLAQGMGK